MNLLDYKGYTIWLPISGGKAGKGCAKTGSLQARYGNVIYKQVSFVIDVEGSRKKAYKKLKEWIDANPPKIRF